MNFRPFIDRVTRLFKNPFREANPVSIKSDPLKVHRIMVGERLSKQDQITPWCYSFMRRNGNIVPGKSPLSIYYSAMKPRRSR